MFLQSLDGNLIISANTSGIKEFIVMRNPHLQRFTTNIKRDEFMQIELEFLSRVDQMLVTTKKKDFFDYLGESGSRENLLKLLYDHLESESDE